MLLFTPPVAVNLITSAPCEICRRTARRQSSAPLQVLVARDRRSSSMSRFTLLAASACPPVPEIPKPAATIVGPAIRPDAMRIPQRRHAVDVGAEVAHRREPGLERPARVVDADQQVVLDVAVEGLEPRPHLVVVREDVDVGVDEARQDELALEVDQPGAVGRRDMAVTDRFDAPAADDDRGRPARRLTRTIEQRTSVDDERRARSRAARTAARRPSVETRRLVERVRCTNLMSVFLGQPRPSPRRA